MSDWRSSSHRLPLALLFMLAACGAPPPAAPFTTAGSGGRAAAPAVPSHAASPAAGVGLPSGQATRQQVVQGRRLIIARGCADCHGGPDALAPGWLAGNPTEGQAYVMGEYRAWARNLTPDPATGLGNFSERQIFNALRWGLRPGATADVEITSPAPGEGNHPVQPDYLSPLMPWTSWRHMTDEELWAVVAYLKHGLGPVHNPIPDPVSPSDRWASWFTPAEVGTHPLPPFPTANEELAEGADREQVLRGRKLVASVACSECHGGRGNPAGRGWLVGVLSEEERPAAIPFEKGFQLGPFGVYPRNLTPHNTTGMGRFSERQIFNALRYGLRPGETADVEITSTTPGEGNHPLHGKYLAPAMPWPAWRHLSDDEIRAIAAYLKQGLKPVANRVPDSEGPPDFWAGVFTPESAGVYPAPPYPSGNERPVQ